MKDKSLYIEIPIKLTTNQTSELNSGNRTCKYCGSSNIKYNKVVVTGNVGEYTTRCLDCLESWVIRLEIEIVYTLEGEINE